MQPLTGPLITCRVLERGRGRAIQSDGHELRVKVDSAETGAAFAFGEYLVPAAGCELSAPHVHRAASETVYVLEGTLEVRTGTRTIAAAAGACVHVPAGAVHAFANRGPGPVRFLQLVSPGTLLTMIEELSALAQAGINDGEQIAAVYRRHDTEVVG